MLLIYMPIGQKIRRCRVNKGGGSIIGPEADQYTQKNNLLDWR